MFRFVIMQRAMSGWMSILLLLPALAGETEDRHFQTTRLNGNDMIQVDNFRFDKDVLSMDAPAQWFGIYFTEGTMVRYSHRTVNECSIEVYQSPLQSAPTNEVAARIIYENEIQKINPLMFDRGIRQTWNVTLPSSFPMTFILSATTNQPPTQMRTYFVQAPYLYLIKLEVPEKLLGHIRSDYSSVLSSIRITNQESSEAQASTPVAAPANAPGNSAPASAPPLP